MYARMKWAAILSQVPMLIILESGLFLHDAVYIYNSWLLMDLFYAITNCFVLFASFSVGIL